MPFRHLFGPVTAEYAGRCLAGPRAAGRCLAFGPGPGLDLPAAPGDSWDEIARRLPRDWRPDFAALYLPYTAVPRGLWSAPVPLVGLAPDWNLLWHHYRHALPRCDLVLTDRPGVAALKRQGIAHARAANLFGLGRDFLDADWPDGPRDIDILFVGNLHPAVQRERLPWLGRLARLAGRRRVRIATGVFGADYRRLLGRARVAFNRSARGEGNMRAFEAAAAGALLFQERGNREVAGCFADRKECVFYGNDDLEELLEYYLGREDERRALADAARARAPEFAFEALWGRALEVVGREWNDVAGRAARRVAAGANAWPPEALAWEALGGAGSSPGLAAALAASAETDGGATAWQAAALAAALAGGAAVAPLRRAVSAAPDHPGAALGVAEALRAAGRADEALAEARRALGLLDRADPDPGALDLPPYPAGYDLLRVEWERAAWDHASRPADEARAKRELLRWRLHVLLAGLTGDLTHFHEAALARPDLPTTRAALGCALARASRLAEALPHLRLAAEADPFDAAAARALAQALNDLGDADGRRQHAEGRRLLASAAPGIVEAEPWFADAPDPATNWSRSSSSATTSSPTRGSAWRACCGTPGRPTSWSSSTTPRPTAPPSTSTDCGRGRGRGASRSSATPRTSASPPAATRGSPAPAAPGSSSSTTTPSSPPAGWRASSPTPPTASAWSDPSPTPAARPRKSRPTTTRGCPASTPSPPGGGANSPGGASSWSG